MRGAVTIATECRRHLTSASVGNPAPPHARSDDKRGRDRLEFGVEFHIRAAFNGSTRDVASLACSVPPPPLLSRLHFHSRLRCQVQLRPGPEVPDPHTSPHSCPNNTNIRPAGPAAITLALDSEYRPSTRFADRPDLRRRQARCGIALGPA